MASFGSFTEDELLHPAKANIKMKQNIAVNTILIYLSKATPPYVMHFKFVFCNDFKFEFSIKNETPPPLFIGAVLLSRLLFS